MNSNMFEKVTEKGRVKIQKLLETENRYDIEPLADLMLFAGPSNIYKIINKQNNNVLGNLDKMALATKDPEFLEPVLNHLGGVFVPVTKASDTPVRDVNALSMDGVGSISALREVVRRALEDNYLSGQEREDIRQATRMVNEEVGKLNLMVETLLGDTNASR